MKKPEAMIHIGSSPETIREARESILALLKSGAEQETIRAAIKAFTEVAGVSNTAISNCNFVYGDGK